MRFTDSHLAFRRKASDLSNRTSKILTVLLHASKCSFHVLACMLFPYKFWSGGCLTVLPWSWAPVRKLNTQMFPNSLASFNMLWPHLCSGLWFWSFATVKIPPWLLFFILWDTNSSSPVLALFNYPLRLMFDHGDLNLAKSARHQPWGCLYSGLGGKESLTVLW